MHSFNIGGQMKMKKTKTNQTYSNRVVKAEFDHNWESTITSTGYLNLPRLKSKDSNAHASFKTLC